MMRNAENIEIKELRTYVYTAVQKDEIILQSKGDK